MKKQTFSRRPLFLFGTLTDAALRAIVAQGALDPLPGAAILPGHRVRRAAGATYPVLVPDPAAAAPGILVDPDPAMRDRIDRFEALFGYVPRPVAVEHAGARLLADCYLAGRADTASPEDWSLDRWPGPEAALFREMAAEIMGHLEERPVDSVVPLLPAITRHAASRLRARANRAPGKGQPAAHKVTRPHARFFTLEEHRFRQPTHGGGLTPPVARTVFVTGDAVTVLPYDPRRDCVLLVEQFRAGPMARGDPDPWYLEPVAGRIDGVETPEAAARREAAEEAGLTLGRMVPAGRYYPSAGAVSEHVTGFLAEADLSGAGGLHGAAEEDEDILAHVLPAEQAIALLDAGCDMTATLIVALAFLDRHRTRLRRDWRGA